MIPEPAAEKDAELTRNQNLVFAVLEAAGRPLSAYEILGRVREDGVKAPLQVYRALDKLQAAGFVHRLESINAYVKCSHAGCDHPPGTAFMICTQCGATHEICDAYIDNLVSRHASANGYTAENRLIEVMGICSACQQEAA